MAEKNEYAAVAVAEAGGDYIERFTGVRIHILVGGGGNQG